MTQPLSEPTPSFDASIPAMHWMFLLMAIGIMILSFAMGSEGNTKVTLPGFDSPLPEMCGTKAYLGIACPGCGLTRSFISISHGKFAKAWGLNPASMLVYVFVAVQIPWQAFQLWRIYRGKPIIQSIWVFAPLVACALALFVQWLFKLSMGTWIT